MIDLTPVEQFIKDGKAFVLVDGVDTIKPALEKGFNAQEAAFVVPLLTPVTPIASGQIDEYSCIEKFAVIIGLKKSGKGSNARLSQLHDAVLNAVLGKTLPGTETRIKLGNGGQLPTKLTNYVFWQIEFSLQTFTRAN